MAFVFIHLIYNPPTNILKSTFKHLQKMHLIFLCLIIRKFVIKSQNHYVIWKNFKNKFVYWYSLILNLLYFIAHLNSEKNKLHLSIQEKSRENRLLIDKNTSVSINKFHIFRYFRKIIFSYFHVIFICKSLELRLKKSKKMQMLCNQNYVYFKRKNH